jgi:rhodanese-related sulfurtransferase
MKKIASILVFIIIFSACAFLPPDYLKLITVTELSKTMEKEDVFLVDVHTPKQRHIKGTDVFIPYNEVEQFIDKLPEDKTALIYLYCEGGPMGNAAARSLYQLGYQNLINLDGGAKAWRKAGLPLE